MKTFSIQTLGCKVNFYESEQIARLLRSRGLTQTDPPLAELRVINTCSITTAAASQSRQSVRRVVRLPMLEAPAAYDTENPGKFDPSTRSSTDRLTTACARPRIIVTGCWATSDREQARALPGVDAVLGHHENVAAELNQLLANWEQQDQRSQPAGEKTASSKQLPGPDASNEKNNGWMLQAGTSASKLTPDIKPSAPSQVNRNFVDLSRFRNDLTQGPGTRALPLLDSRQNHRQRALLKVQDGCDAHCTYCIIPSLRPNLWSKPVEQAVNEAKALVAAGHAEIILTGIFLGAYGQPTALRRRQQQDIDKPLGRLIEALCAGVSGLRRLRLSSLEPGDLNQELIDLLRSHLQVVPHFHLPLQSGSDLILRRMNRQYTRDDFLEMVDRLNEAFDRPALTTDIVVGFPGEDDAEFEQTAEVVRKAGFIHVHAFPYSPRPGTAAARWKDQFIYGPVIQERIERLSQLAQASSLRFRQSFVGQTVEVIVERDDQIDRSPPLNDSLRHGRCERYFSVYFDDAQVRRGDLRTIRITRATASRTIGATVNEE